jgi:hypothetical protein
VRRCASFARKPPLRVLRNRPCMDTTLRLLILVGCSSLGRADHGFRPRSLGNLDGCSLAFPSVGDGDRGAIFLVHLDTGATRLRGVTACSHPISARLGARLIVLTARLVTQRDDLACLGVRLDLEIPEPCVCVGIH